jgi:hypothetical protein
MRIGNADQAVVDLRKLRDYCLSPEHPRGRHKARLFKSVLGWAVDDAAAVRQRLLDAVRSHDATSLGSDDYGQRYALDFNVEGVEGPATVRSLWIVRAGEGFPRLTTCYLL